MPARKPPIPPDRSAVRAPRGGRIADARRKFERSATSDDAERTRAFIAHKIEILRDDPRMREEERAAAIAELEAKLRRR